MHHVLQRTILLLLGSWALATAQSNPDAEQPASGSFAFTDSLDLPASPPIVFGAITGDISGWWDHSFSAKPYRLFIEPKPGGGFWELFNAGGDGVLHATVTMVEQNKALRFVGPLGLAGTAITMVTTLTLRDQGASTTRLVLEVHAAGEVGPATGGMVHGVWHHFLVDRLKPFLAGRPR